MSQAKLDAVIEGYLAYLLDVRRKVRRTVVDVRCTLKGMDEAMREHRPDLPLWKQPLEQYIRWTARQRGAGRSARSLCKSLSHVRGLLDYAWRSGHCDRNVLDGFTIQDDGRRVIPTFLSEQEARQLVEACPAGTPLQRAERMIVLLLYGCGLRTDELCRLDVGDVDRERKEVTVWHGKGDRQRIVPIPQALFTELLAYLLERGGKRGALLRTAIKQQRISARTVCDVVRRAAERARIAKLVTPKTLRHSYATHLMDRGVDLAIIASLMGHRSPAETGVYLHVLEERPRQAVDRLGGLEGAKQP